MMHCNKRLGVVSDAYDAETDDKIFDFSRHRSSPVITLAFEKTICHVTINNEHIKNFFFFEN